MFNPTFDAEDVTKTILFAAAMSHQTRLTKKEINDLLDQLFKENQIAYFGFSRNEWAMLRNREMIWSELCRLRNLLEGEEAATSAASAAGRCRR